MVEVKCPVCSSNQSRVYMNLDATRIVQCCKCTCCYVSPRIQDDEIQKRVQSWADSDVMNAGRFEEYFNDGALQQYNREIGIISGYTKERSLLDVGCSVGAFMKTAQKRGYDVKGVEVGKASAGYVEKVLKYPILNNDFLTAEIEDDAFDVITMYEVIEHLTEPKRAVQKVLKKLRSNGVLAMSTPNVNAITATVLKKNWWVINCPDEHIVLFTPKTLKRMLEDVGFRVLAWRTEGVSPTVLVKALTGKKENWATQQKSRESVRESFEKYKMKKMIPFLKSLVDVSFKMPFSPLYGRGERLFVYARKEGC